MGRFQGYADRILADREAKVGTFYPYSTSSRPPRLLAEKLGGNRDLAWLSTLGGYIRVAPGPLDDKTPFIDFQVGDYFVDGTKAKIPGFASGTHVDYPDGIKVRVDKAAQEGSLRMRSMQGRPPLIPMPPPVQTARPGLIERIKTLYRDAGGDPSSAIAWAEKAPIEKVEAWLAESEGGAK